MSPPIPGPSPTKQPLTIEDIVFGLDRGELSPDDRDAWEPRRQRLVRDWWRLSGAIGFGVSAITIAFRHLQHPLLGFSVITAVELFLFTTLIGTGLGLTLVHKQVAQKRNEFVRSRRLREKILQVGDA